MNISSMLINNGIINIIQKEKEAKRATTRKKAYSEKTIRHDIYDIKRLFLRDGYKVSEMDLW